MGGNRSLAEGGEIPSLTKSLGFLRRFPIETVSQCTLLVYQINKCNMRLERGSNPSCPSNHAVR